MIDEGPTARTIRSKLAAAFAPQTLEIIDDSSRHAGHSGSRPGGETHFNLVIVASAFEGLPRIQRQRQINQVLAEELAGPVHALSIRALAPGEA
jgi:BolA protein